MSANDNNGISRRLVLKGTGALLGTAVGGGIALAAPGRKGKKKRAATLRVPRKVLGKTKQKIPILLFGAAMKLDAKFDPKLAEAFRYGVDYIDAARVYSGGTCEPAVGAYHTRAKNRKKLWITSKSEKHDPQGFATQLDASLQDLKTNYLDLYFMHGLRDPKYLSPEMAKAADKAKQAGKLRFMGFSAHHGNVAELLAKAAELPWIDAVMFRYNFRQYGNVELNKAMDACAKAGVGLIAMKTQSAAASFEDKWKPFEKTGKWNKHQAVLKAVWADERITAAVSHMDTLEILEENVAAAMDTKLSRLELEQLRKYAELTRPYTCDGCDHLCGAAVDAPVAIGDTLRFLMYHDVYGEQDKARSLFRGLPAAAQQLSGVDFRGGQAACPHGVQLTQLMDRAREVLC